MGAKGTSGTKLSGASLAYNIWCTKPHPLDLFFKPKSVAVFGATETQGSVGRALITNLLSHSFGGTVFPVNPKRSSIFGLKSYGKIQDINEKIELAVIATPAQTVPEIIKECVQVGVKSAIIISAGFKETGEAGKKLEEEILKEAEAAHMRIIGPNCLGVMSPLSGFNATFADRMALKGNVGFISQSGALCTAVLDWSIHEKVGFSHFVSIGSMLDVEWGDLIHYLGDDPNTQSILLYMETIGDARYFLSAARSVALTKPIIVIKAGRTEAAAKAAISHTGSLAGSDDVLETAFRRAGILRVSRISDLFYMAGILAKQPRPKGPRLAMITNAGGPGVLATDALISAGGDASELSAETVNSLNQILPPHWSHNNPVDILGDASPDRYAQAVEIAAKDPNTDGLLVILTPQAMTDPTQTAEELKKFAHIPGKPILASWMGADAVERGKEILTSASIPVFSYPDTAARLFQYMWRYSYNLKSIYETPSLANESGHEKGSWQAKQIILKAQESGKILLNEVESKELLTAYQIPCVETMVAKNEEEAVTLSEKIGYPVVLKIFSDTITHKTDVGGVELNLADRHAVKLAYRKISSSVKNQFGTRAFQGVTVQPMIRRDGYELIIGSSIDPQFGPVLVFGSGGQLVEVFKDRSLILPPLNTTLARRAMEQTKIYSALKGVRGKKPVNFEELQDLLVRFSQLVVEQPRIKEIDINPLLVSSEQIIALDARVVLHPAEIKDHELPQVAIRPYPSEYVQPWIMKDGTKALIRPIRSEDEPLMIQFHKTLSEQSIRQRYFHMIKLDERIKHERLVRVCLNDYDREIALVVELEDSKTNTKEIIAVGRLSRLHGRNEAEFSMIVSDQFQRQGVGTKLLGSLLGIARREKIGRVIAESLPDNFEMQQMAKKYGFKLRRENDAVEMEIELSGVSSTN